MLKNTKGYTLIEIVVVLAVVFILASAGIPSFKSWFVSTRANGAARRLYGDMRFAKMAAISANREFIVTFDPTTHSYTINDDLNGNGAVDAGEEVRAVTVSSEYPDIEMGYIAGNDPRGGAISESVTFTGTPKSVTFTPTGLANKNGYVFIKPVADTDKKDRQRALSIIQTGRIRLYKHTGTGNTWE